MPTPIEWTEQAKRILSREQGRTCLKGAWPCYAHERHVLKRGRYYPGSVPEEYGAGDWEPAGA